MAKNQVEIEELLDKLNRTYVRLDTAYEKQFWKYYMYDHSAERALNEAQAKRDAFKSSAKLATEVDRLLPQANAKNTKRLKYWQHMFSLYRVPPELAELRQEIAKLENQILKKHTTRKEGYRDPKTGKFKKASSGKLRFMMSTHDDEPMRKAAFEAMEELSVGCLDEYVALVNMRNEFAQKLGYDDFYDYKIQIEEGMTKKQLFALFDPIYNKTTYAFADIKERAKKIPGLRKPWNFGYKLAGDYTKRNDPYFQFDDAVMRWGRSFAALGIDYRGGEMVLDLVDRPGKYSNGFCHWPRVVHYKDGKRVAGRAQFTANAVYGQMGAGKRASETLFHEGGHAAHLLNADQTEACLNDEYPPASTAWDETQSMFLDTMMSSIEWRVRYAKNAEGESYPMELFEDQVRDLSLLRPLGMHGIMFVMNFEREIYEAKNLTTKKVVAIAKRAYKKFFDRSVPSVLALSIPHIYSWESSCSYHGYGLARLALTQWREYFYKKYGHIVDNPKVGREMTKVWKLGSSTPFPDCVKLATGKKLSSAPYIKTITMSADQVIRHGRKRVGQLASVRPFTRPVNLNATITMVHGDKTIATNKKSFEDMARRYEKWLKTLS